MQGYYGSDKGRKIDDKMHVIRLHYHGLHQLIHIQIRQEIEYVLQIVCDLVVDRNASLNYLLQIIPDLNESPSKAGQSVDLLFDLQCQSACRWVINISKKVLDANLK